MVTDDPDSSSSPGIDQADTNSSSQTIDPKAVIKTPQDSNPEKTTHSGDETQTPEAQTAHKVKDVDPSDDLDLDTSTILDFKEPGEMDICTDGKLENSKSSVQNTV